MIRRLPSMQVLQAFAATARTGSMTRAADALCVTHGAISRHIRALETLLGCALFVRAGRHLELTATGRELADELDRALRAVELSLAGAAERRARERQSLNVNVSPELAGAWLVPKLQPLREALPGLDLSIAASTEDPDFDRSDLDVSLRYGPAPFTGYQNVKLLDDDIIAVCSPAFAQQHAGMTAADTAQLPRLRHARFRWAQWAAAAGVVLDEPGDGIVFDCRALLIEAAANGLGLALTRALLAREAIAAGRLVQPLPASFPASHNCYVVWRGDNPKQGLIRQFAQWLREAAAPPSRVQA
ncbi:DNA-binding transcriptional activator GcvA [Cupriavidus sp. TA19]|uniref:LysR substrate-binding domain-containing protein n=1 Tax=unclassified Cupriavidus TaxID=2640874 RepID=UPI0027294D2A|nr:LysR substrate-binding domain-containing protein [Cupriavidus sp. TA19]GLC95442.1 DNA-binding transcriptional activator GcvA [Cupriavidus sp. TA19]